MCLWGRRTPAPRCARWSPGWPTSNLPTHPICRAWKASAWEPKRCHELNSRSALPSPAARPRLRSAACRPPTPSPTWTSWSWPRRQRVTALRRLLWAGRTGARPRAMTARTARSQEPPTAFGWVHSPWASILWQSKQLSWLIGDLHFPASRVHALNHCVLPCISYLLVYTGLWHWAGRAKSIPAACRGNTTSNSKGLSVDSLRSATETGYSACWRKMEGLPSLTESSSRHEVHSDPRCWLLSGRLWGRHCQVVFPVWFSAGPPFVGSISEGSSLAGASQCNREMFFPFIFLVMLLAWLWACRNQPKESCRNIADMSCPKSWRFF